MNARLPLAGEPELRDRALVEAPRPSVIWLQLQECTGCTESLLRAEHPELRDIIQVRAL